MAQVQVGVIAYRDKHGNFTGEKKPIYEDVPTATVEAQECATYDKFAKEILLPKLREYMDGETNKTN